MDSNFAFPTLPMFPRPNASATQNRLFLPPCLKPIIRENPEPKEGHKSLRRNEL